MFSDVFFSFAEGKTDYRARKRLVCQDKNKYNSPKYRLVVRFSNKKVTCQIVYAELVGDKVLASAYSTELPRYGLEVGLKNYAAAYCTGLLVARRLLNKLGLEEAYPGQEEPDAEVVSTEHKGKKYFVAEVDDEKRPFRAVLDVGVKNTTTGARLFGALKGAVDGGLDIPHSNKRFPGYDRDSKKYEADVHKDRIFGEHVAEYMRKLLDEDQAKYNTHFRKFIEAEVEPDDLEELYGKVHAAIREDPSPAEKKVHSFDGKFKKTAKLSLEERKAAIAEKKATIAANKAAAGGDDEDDDEEEADAGAEAAGSDY